MKPNEKQCSICGAKGVTEMDVHGPCGFVEPGADTGTTPPIEELISKWSNELVYSLDEAEIDLIEKIAPLILRDMAAAERGPTPPEGLAFTFEEFIDMSLRHNKRLAAGISGIASFGHWYNEMLAATQRAPVEQGREKRLPDGAEAMMLDVAEDISQQFCGGSEAVTEIIAAKLTEIIYNSKPTAAPDHAREGALRDLVAKWRGLRGVDWSAEPDGWKVTFNVCADELERALADGKEGGE